MATLSVPVPDQYVDEALLAVASSMLDSPTASVVTIANKVIAGQATTASEKQQLGAAFCQRAMKQAWVNLKAAQAGDTARASANAAVW